LPENYGRRERLLRQALAESLSLQSHYAELLNGYDAGRRLTFPTVDAWLERLVAIEKLPPLPDVIDVFEGVEPPEDGELRVVWVIDVPGGDGPVAAAQEALMIQRDPDSLATIFDVIDHRRNRKLVDLSALDSPTQRFPSGDPPIQSLAPPGDPAVSEAFRAAARQHREERWGYWCEFSQKFIGDSFPSYNAAVDALDPRLSVTIRQID
jgi:hypothetical protein